MLISVGVLSKGLRPESSSSSESSAWLSSHLVSRPRAPWSLTPQVRILLSLVRAMTCMPPQEIWTTPTSVADSMGLRRGRLTSMTTLPSMRLWPRPSSPLPPSPKT